MKITRILVSSTLALALTACFATGGSSSTTAPVAKTDTTLRDALAKEAAHAKSFNLYVGSTQKTVAKPAKKTKKSKKSKAVAETPAATVEVMSDNVTYYTSGAIVSNADVRNAFVAKTVAGEPALGVRLTDAANARLSSALRANMANTVLASLNNSVFAKVNNADAKLQDGVLLIPMKSLNDARDLANLLRKK